MANKDLDKTEKEMLVDIASSVNIIGAEIKHHSNRLSKIEDAIIQLAATQERVRGLEDSLRESSRNQQLTNAQMWDEFKLLTNAIHSISETKAELVVTITNNSERISKLEEFKDEIDPEMKMVVKMRSAFEKAIVAIVLFIILGIVGSFFVFTPNKAAETKLTKIESLLEKHIDENSFNSTP